MKIVISTIFFMVFSMNGFATYSKNKKDEILNKEIIEWTGTLVSGSGHTDRHNHSLKFIRQSDGESFDIVNSPETQKIHCDKSKNLLVKIKGKKTSKFLFWGGNLIVQKFEVLEELDDVPHELYQGPKVKRWRNFERGGGK